MTMINSTVCAINVTSNFSDSIGDIRNNFYGVNSHKSFFNGTYNTIDSDGDGVNDADSNYTWHSDTFLNSNMDYLRWDMSLATYYSDSDDDSVNFTGDLTRNIEGIKWCNENNIKVTLIASYMPTWLADTTKNCSANNQYCPPSNVTEWANLVLDYVTRITSSGLYNSSVEVEIWNEPDVSFFMPDLGLDDSLKAIEYNIIYNETYDLIKGTYPDMSVGGLALTSITSNNLRDAFLSNFSSKMDFFSYHEYGIPFHTEFENELSTLFTQCTTYSANCSRVLINEFNLGATTGAYILNTSSRSEELSMRFGRGYNFILNNYPENISLNVYQWAGDKKYASGISYPDYPSKYTMVSEPDLDNELTSVYNTTKMFATYHASGNTVYNSTATNSTIKMTTSRDGESSYFAIINTNNGIANINLSIDGIELTNLEDLEDSTKYAISNSVIDLGTFSAYEIKYLRNDECYWSGTNNYDLNLSRTCSDITGSFSLDGDLIPQNSGTATLKDLDLSVNKIVFPSSESNQKLVFDNSKIIIG